MSVLHRLMDFLPFELAVLQLAWAGIASLLGAERLWVEGVFSAGVIALAYSGLKLWTNEEFRAYVFEGVAP